MKLAKRLGLAALLWLAPPMAGATDSDARIDSIFAAWNRPDTPGAAVAVVRDGQRVYSRGYGMANLEHGVPVTPSTRFHLGSLSKQFTAFAIHMLAQEGRLSLDDDVRHHVPGLQGAGPAITLRHLLHHTSGLRDHWDLLQLSGRRLDDAISGAEILALVQRQRGLNFAPGDEELYSNSGYALLALVASRVSGRSFAQLAQERIFGPLGMHHTEVQEHDGNVVKQRAVSYARHGGGYRSLALSHTDVGGTGVISTVEDLAVWAQQFHGPLARQMEEPGRLNGGSPTVAASGLMRGTYRGQPMTWHSGVDAGFRSQMLRLPAQGLTVFVLGNTGEMNAPELARQVADVYLDGMPGVGRAPPLPPDGAVHVDPDDLAGFAGEFEWGPARHVAIEAQAGGLVARVTGERPLPLFAASPDRFFSRDGRVRIAFHAPPAGEWLVRSATWTQDGVDHPLKRRTRIAPASGTLQACEGDFYSPELVTTYTLSLASGRPRLHHPRGEWLLDPLSGHEFAFPLPGSVALELDAQGRCVGLVVSTERVRRLRFDRVDLAR